MTRLFLPFLVIIFFFLSLFAYVKFAGPIPFSINSITTSKTDTFNVTGEGKVTVKPDIATITVGIQANGTSAKDVQDQINKNINKVSDAIKKLGIDQKDIKTQNYNINPTYDYTGGNQKITGYSGNTNLVVKVRKLDNANSILDAAIAQGANQVGNISFDVEDKTKAENEARTMAVAEAKKKAENAAKIAGFSLGKIINYSENQGRMLEPVPMMKAADSGMGLGGGGTQVEPGSNEINLTVTLSYEIK